MTISEELSSFAPGKNWCYLLAFADEVYQETVFTNEVQLHSCKEVLRDLGPEYNKFQLMSIYSASKGFYGEYVQRDFVISKTQQRSMRRALKQTKLKKTF